MASKLVRATHIYNLLIKPNEAKQSVEILALCIAGSDAAGLLPHRIHFNIKWVYSKYH